MKDNELNNTLIAEFMGGKYDKDTSFPIHPDDIWLPFHGIVRKKHLSYHTSWDWLMPVVEKIESISDTELTCMTAEIKEYQFQIYLSNTCLRGTNKLELIYQAVVEFIKWYNQQKQ